MDSRQLDRHMAEIMADVMLKHMTIELDVDRSREPPLLVLKVRMCGDLVHMATVELPASEVRP